MARKVSGLETGVLYCNDNVDRLAELPSESVDLIYLDPPFFSNKVYEVIWGDEAEVRSFEDRWEGGIQHYIGWMQDRVTEMHRVLKPTGSFYLHCDPNASHYLKAMLDGVFGGRRFLNEIVWKRTTAHNDPQRYGRIGDRILFYSKTVKKTFNALPGDYSPEQLGRYKYEDVGGRFKGENLTAPHYSPTRTVEWRGVHPGANRQWRFGLDELERLYAEGRILLRRDGKPRKDGLKEYLDPTQSPALQDIWTDIVLGPTDSERLGYPTQKPAALLERIIGASSNEGDIVLDPFCGCGTSVAVSERLRRQWIGIDISPTAIDVMERRLWNESRCVPDVVDAPETEEALKGLKPFEFQNFVINAVNGTHSPRRTGDMGIDGFWFFTKDPIQVKQSEHVGRNVVDNFETAMRRGNYDTGYIMAFSFTRGAVEEVARAKHDGLNIKLVRVKEILLLKRRESVPRNLGPQPEGEIIPLPPTREKSDLPSVEQLVKSDKQAAG